MRTSKVWEILRKFKELCRFHGWRTSENEDWIETGSEFHNFLLTRDVHPSSFKTIAANRKCIVREGLSYRVVEAAYTAWLFSEAPHENIVKMFLSNPEFLKRTALYDLSPIMEGRNTCLKLNCTSSPVFREFEKFLEKELGIKVEPYTDLDGSFESFTFAEVS
ncbi:hypothetical protein KEJ45_00585 [Candidatus Bathyarchaeota archaeon]|nr:hypothetical protein [Candidatus Bathyarchaeota archaeon]